MPSLWTAVLLWGVASYGWPGALDSVDVTYASASRVNTGTACAYADAVHLLVDPCTSLAGLGRTPCTPHAIRIGQLCGATSCLCLASMRWWLDGLLIAFGWATPLLGSKGMEANLHRCGFNSTH